MPDDVKKQRPRGKVHVNREACKGCGFCAEFCPSHVLKLSGDFNAKGYHPPLIVDEQGCTACGLCGMYCPEFAIFATRTDKTEGKK